MRCETADSRRQKGRKVDHEQVVKMSVYLTNAVIAKRLGISERQVSRILKKWAKPKNRVEDRRTNDSETEILYMKAMRRCELSYGSIAYRFGLSRQAVQQRLTEN